MTSSDLRAWRTHMGYTQQAAAEALGMTASNYKDLELGKRRSTGRVIDALDRRTELACAALLQKSTGGKWYCVDNVGAATLCVDEEDALKTAKDAAMMWPKNAPYKAVILRECTLK